MKEQIAEKTLYACLCGYAAMFQTMNHTPKPPA